MPIVVRVKWSGGYVEVVGPGGGTRRTIPFDAGQVKTRAKAIEVGQTVLAEWADRPIRSWQTRVGYTPTWPSVGDRIETYDVDGSFTDVRLASRRVSILPGGYASLEPTMGTRRDLLVERNQRALKKLTDGLQGRSSASDPLLVERDTGFTSGQMTEVSIPVVSNSGIKIAKSPETKLSELTTLVRLEAALTMRAQNPPADPNNPLSGDVSPTIPATLPADITLAGWFDGQPVWPLIFPANYASYDWLIANAWPAGTRIQFGIVNRGPFAVNTSALRNARTLTVKLFGVTGTWVQETEVKPEIR